MKNKFFIISIILIFLLVIIIKPIYAIPTNCQNPGGSYGGQIDCTITNYFGICQGTQTCSYNNGYYYWSDCTPSDPNFINYGMSEAEAEGIDIYSYYTGLLSCEDGIDNDCDGLIDSQDDGCDIIQNCVKVDGVDYCCSTTSDGICPENYENAFNEIISCSTFGITDPDCIVSQPCRINLTISDKYCGSDHLCGIGENISIFTNSTGDCQSTNGEDYIGFKLAGGTSGDYCFFPNNLINAPFDENNILYHYPTYNASGDRSQYNNYTIISFPNSTNGGPCLGKTVSINFPCGGTCPSIKSFPYSNYIFSPLNNITFEGGTTNCVIMGAQIIPACGSDGICSTGDNIKIEINYSGTGCPTPSYIQVDAKSLDGICDIQNYGGTLQGMNIICNNGICIGQWSIPTVPSQCLGKIVYAYAVGLYHDSINTPNRVTGNTTTFPPGYGSFNFSSIPSGPTYNLSVYTRSWPGLGLITGVNVLLDGVDKGLTINPKILTFVPQGIHTISGTSKIGYTVNPVTLDVTQNIEIIVIYNNTQLNSFNFNITAKDKDTKEIIAAPITLQLTNSSGTFTVKTVTNGSLIYDYTKAYPMNYTITFWQVSGYTETPKKVQGSTNSNGFLWLNAYYTPETCTQCSDGTLPGACASETKYCNPNTCKFTLCSSGYTCIANQGCVLETAQVCTGYTSETNCLGYPYCYWNASAPICNVCGTNGRPTACSDYKSQPTCEKDNCGMNVSGADVGICSGADISCKCEWLNDACNLVARDSTGGSCTSIITAQTECGTSSCIGNQRMVTFDKAWSPEAEPAPETCQDGSTCVACAGFRLLPGFDYINVILALALFAGYYSYSFVKKKK